MIAELAHTAADTMPIWRGPLVLILGVLVLVLVDLAYGDR